MMNDRQPDGQVRAGSAGLCERCQHMRPVVTDRGARFVLCGKSAADPRFPRYPVIPVLACRGFAPAAAPADGR